MPLARPNLQWPVQAQADGGRHALTHLSYPTYIMAIASLKEKTWQPYPWSTTPEGLD